jgi:SAM-dependent methyltransferase
MYIESAPWYDLFAREKDYAGEARQVRELADRRVPEACRLLDVACGTGLHLEHLSQWFACEGLDLDEALLEQARRRLPGVRFTRADLTSFDVGRRFDVVTCLFSSIGYAGTVDRLHSAIAAMARHLAPAGMLVVEPWLTPDNWDDTVSPRVDVVDHDQGTVVRVGVSRREGSRSLVHFHYVHAGSGRIASADEHHQLGLFSRDDYLGAAKAAGLQPEWQDPGLTGRGLLIAVRYPSATA